MPALFQRLIEGLGRATDSGFVQLRMGDEAITWTHPDDTTDRQSDIETALFCGPNGESGEITIGNPRKSGETITSREVLEIAAMVVEHVSDRQAEQMASNDVASQLYRSEERLAETLIRLEESNRQLEQFAYIAAHELLHPLRAVTAFSDLLPDLIAADKPEAVDSCLLSIREGTRSMQKQLTELLKLSSVSTDTAELEVIDMHLCANKAIDALANQLTAIGARVTLGTLPAVRGQAVQMQSIFHNLVANSIRYRAHRRPLEISISGHDTEQESVVLVADNGIGIADSDAERVFGVFERASTNDEGFGIGLALSRRIMEHFGGTITVESSVELGSTFALRFPTLGAIAG